MKKKRIRLPSFLLALLCILLIVPTAFADMGPKASLNITVVNAPEEVVYVDLLHFSSREVQNDWSGFDEADYDPAILAQLHSLEGEGWVLALSTGTGGAPIFGDITPNSSDVYHYGYYGLPDTFRIAVATASGAQATAESYTRSRFVTNLVYDWETNTLREATPTAVFFLSQLASTLIPTLMIECLILLLFKFRQKRTWLIVLIANVVTQIGLHLFCFSTIGSASQFSFYYFLGLFIPEVIIFIVEAVAYRYLAKEHTNKRRILYALCANLASFVLGYFPLHWLSFILNTL